MNNPAYAVWDVESTGIDVFEDRIVQMYFAVIDADGNLLKDYEWFIDPGVPVPKEASDVHGFTTEWLQENGDTPSEALWGIRKVMLDYADLPQIAFNMNYDLSIIDAEMKRHEVTRHLGRWFSTNGKLIDGLVIDRAKDKYRKGKRTLEAQAKHYGVDFNPEEAHSAKYDVLKTAEVTLKIIEKFGRPSTKEQAKMYRDWATNFEKYLRKNDPTASVDTHWPLKQKED